jgi:hypothetical protein
VWVWWRMSDFFILWFWFRASRVTREGREFESPTSHEEDVGVHVKCGFDGPWAILLFCGFGSERPESLGKVGSSNLPHPTRVSEGRLLPGLHFGLRIQTFFI